MVDILTIFSGIVATARLQLTRETSMEPVSASSFLQDQVPTRYQRLFPAALKNAYDAARLFMQSEPILQVPSAQDNKGRIISWAVDLAILRLIESGQWPVDFRWASFARPTGRYLEVKLSHSVLTISQVAMPGVQPRNVVFRSNRRLNNEPFLFPEMNEEEMAIEGRPSFLLVHGHQNLQFAHVGIPNRNWNQGYIYQTQNLLMMPHEVPEPNVPPPENTDNLEAVLSLKAEIEKWATDNPE